MNRTLALLASLPLYAQSPPFTCAPSSPVSTPGQALRLYAWSEPAPGQKLTYRWTVSAGTVQSSGSNVFTWTLSSDSTGTQSADGELRSGTTLLARCFVEIQAVKQLDAPPGESLPAPGLYSYLLTEDKASPAVRSWQALNPAMEALRRLSKPREINALEIPDSARAGPILGKLALSNKPALYIVSSLRPIDESKPPYLIQDLSHVSPEIAAAWIEAFINEAAQEREWNPETEASLVDQLRTAIHAMVKTAFQPKWIVLF